MKKIQNLNLEIIFFTSPLCGSCPKLEKRLLETITKKRLPIKVTKIDVMSDPETAEKYNIIACPTLIFRDFMSVCGCFELEDLEELVSTYFSSSFEFQHEVVNAPAFGGDNYV